MRVREDKVELAKLLWPVLRTRCETEYANGVTQTPVLRLVLEVQDLVDQLRGVFALQG
ncbi:hypothetical protein LX88_008408 [Lentzea californiensis]|nr:hypothetical protein [Lentzea californiensis]